VVRCNGRTRFSLGGVSQTSLTRRSSLNFAGASRLLKPPDARRWCCDQERMHYSRPAPERARLFATSGTSSNRTSPSDTVLPSETGRVAAALELCDRHDGVLQDATQLTTHSLDEPLTMLIRYPRGWLSGLLNHGARTRGSTLLTRRESGVGPD